MWSKKAKTLECAVEYYAPHWIVLVRNAGQSTWMAVRDPDKKITVQDEFGDTVRERPAIRVFATPKLASDWVADNLPDVPKVAQRTESEAKAFMKGLSDSRSLAIQPLPTTSS
jgi:hypothetical protein